MPVEVELVPNVGNTLLVSGELGDAGFTDLSTVVAPAPGLGIWSDVVRGGGFGGALGGE